MLKGADREPVHANSLLRKPLALVASLNDALETAPIVHVRGRVKEVLGTVVRATARSDCLPRSTRSPAGLAAGAARPPPPQ